MQIKPGGDAAHHNMASEASLRRDMADVHGRQTMGLFREQHSRRVGDGEDLRLGYVSPQG